MIKSKKPEEQCIFRGKVPNIAGKCALAHYWVTCNKDRCPIWRAAKRR